MFVFLFFWWGERGEGVNTYFSLPLLNHLKGKKGMLNLLQSIFPKAIGQWFFKKVIEVLAGVLVILLLQCLSSSFKKEVQNSWKIIMDNKISFKYVKIYRSISL